MVAQKLKDEGHQQITRDQLNQAVDDALRRIQQAQSQQQQQQQQQQPQQQQPQQQTSAPPPYTKMPPATQPSTTEAPGFSKAATAGPTPDPRYTQYRY
jgi:hypothetical protein